MDGDDRSSSSWRSGHAATQDLAAALQRALAALPELQRDVF
jgi:DNA-directed RNA polymerase specialized sigma24 family protein